MCLLKRITMTQTAEALGFTYSRKGCPCNGSPSIYTKEVDKTVYTLTIWPRRDVWQLKAKGCLLASGTAENMTTKIKAIWDL